VSLADLESKLDELTELCEALLSKQSQLQADNVRLSQQRQSRGHDPKTQVAGARLK